MFKKQFLGACMASVSLSLKLANQTPSAFAQILEEAKAPISGDVCQRTATRNKLAVPNFYQLYEQNNLFEDLTFPHTDQALAWTDAGEVYTSKTEAEGAVWMRAKDAFP